MVLSFSTLLAHLLSDLGFNHSAVRGARSGHGVFGVASCVSLWPLRPAFPRRRAKPLLLPPNAFSQLKFSDVCELFEAIREVNKTGYKGNEDKRRLLNQFFKAKTSTVCDGNRVGSYDLYRLLLPNIDKERSAYMLKEAALANCLGQALGLKRSMGNKIGSPDFDRLEGWRKHGSGDFTQTVYEVVSNHRPRDGVLRATVGDINNALDGLSKSKNSNEKIVILRSVIDAADARQVRWLVGIILKDLKLGYGEMPILRNYHPDAVDLYNVCCDLRRVCETLHTISERFKRQDLEPGSLVKAMMASRAKGCDGAFRDMSKGEEFIIETKFDGERIQVHRAASGDGKSDVFHYFTRNNNDFGPRGYDILDKLFRARLRRKKKQCVFDGELVVWNKRDGKYAPFGFIKTLVKAIREKKEPTDFCMPDEYRTGNAGRRRFGRRRRDDGNGGDDDGEDDENEIDQTEVDPDVEKEAEPEEQPLCVADLDLVYVVFDVLYDEDHSVIDRPLCERHEVLKAMFKPVGECDDDVSTDGGVKLGPTGVTRGRITLNVPDQGVFAEERVVLETVSQNASDEDKKSQLEINPDCVVGNTLGDVERALWLRIERQEEGVILKDLDSKWVPGERDKKWIKLKPDYLPTEDLDVIVVGGFYGTGKVRGGKIAEYLLGVVEDPSDKGEDEDGLIDPENPDKEPSAKKLPTRVLSFAKVGTGMSVPVMDKLRQRLGPHMLEVKSNVARKNAPAIYATTGASGETPDVWIDHPQNSVVLTVKADLRLVKTATFATSYSLRFPRVTGVRWDKPWHECLSDTELEHKVREDGGMAVAAGKGNDGEDEREKKRQKTRRAVKDASDARLPAHLAVVDVRHVVAKDQILKSLDVVFITAGAGAGAERAKTCADLKLGLAGLLKAHGGTHSEARHRDTTHIIATFEARTSPRYTAAIREGGIDVLTVEWLRACVAKGRVMDPSPKHRLFLSQTTVDDAEGRMDQFGDTHTAELDVEDVMALLSSDRVVAAAAARMGKTDDEEFQQTLREVSEALAPDETPGEKSLYVFRGCVFLVLLAPEFDDSWNYNENARAGAKRLSDVPAEDREADRANERAAREAAGWTRASFAAEALIQRYIAYDPNDHLMNPLGEARRCALVHEVSLRLRGATTEPVTWPRKVTHVLVVTPDGKQTTSNALFGLDGDQWGVGRDAVWVTPAWVKAKIAEGKQVALS